MSSFWDKFEKFKSDKEKGKKAEDDSADFEKGEGRTGLSRSYGGKWNDSWEDWVGGRDSEKGYTRSSSYGSSWADKYKGRSYSSYMFGDSFTLEDKELIRQGYKMAANFVNALIPHKKVHLHFVSEGLEAEKSDAKNLHLSNKVFEDKTITSSERMDVFIGEAIHECSHALYTNFDSKTPSNVIAQSIFNVIEDERVEAELSDEFPGYINYIEKLKKYFYEIDFKRRLADMGIKEATMNESQKMLLSMYHAIRYPKNLTDGEKVQYKKLFDGAKKILTPYPKNTKESVSAAEAIYKLMKQEKSDFDQEMQNDAMKEMLEKNQKCKSGKGGGKGMSTKGMSAEQKKELMEKMLKEMMKNLKEQLKGKAEKKEKGEGKGEGVPVPTPSEEGKSFEEMKDEYEMDKETKDFYDKLMAEFRKMSVDLLGDAEKIMKEMAEKANQSLDSAEAENSTKEAQIAEAFGNGSISNEFSAEMYRSYGGGIGGVNAKTIFYKPQSKSTKYSDYKRLVSPYAGTLNKVLQFRSVDKKLVHKSVRSGYIDTNKLAEAVQGVPTVYERFGHAKSNTVAVCLVVDESGSMSGSKIDKATTAAILLAEALKKNKEIELFVYGHSADISFHGSVDMRIYKEPGYISEGGMGNIPRNQLSNNADGYAIYEAAKRVRKFTNRPCVMFVMSDGAPAASIYNGMDGGVGHTKKMVDKVTKEENMEVIQIAIEGHVPSEKMFKNYVKFTNLSELPSSLGKLVRKIVSKMIQVTVVNY